MGPTEQIIKVLRIPVSGPLEIIQVPTIKFKAKANKHHDFSKRTLNLEKVLGHIPDLTRFQVDWNYRCLFDPKYDNPREGRVFMYKCIENPEKWPRNKCFPNARAYGDAIVFMLNRFTPRDEEGWANYGDVGDFANSVEEGGVGHALLEDMLVNW